MSNRRPADIFNLCQFKFANGRMCGLPAHPKHDGLCLTHARRATPEPREDDLSAEFASPTGDFSTQIDINHVLGKLFTALAANRISPRRAGALAYIAFLLLQSQRGAQKEAGRIDFDYRVLLKLLNVAYPTNGKPVRLNPDFNPALLQQLAQPGEPSTNSPTTSADNSHRSS